MIPWSPVGEQTTVGEGLGHAFVALAGSRAVLIDVRELPPPFPPGSKPSIPDGVQVTSQRSDRPFSRTAATVPPYVTLHSVAVGTGVMPTQILVLPGLRWGLFSGVEIADGGRVMTLGQLLADGPPASVRRAAALARVAEVKEIYGRMLGDVAYRIENAAMFDSAVAATRDFDTAMAMWADGGESADEDEVVRLAGLVKVTFDTARANAETLGLSHLPAQSRADAARAAKAFRLARSATSDGERAVAFAQATRLLDSIAQYYLPRSADLPKMLSDTSR